MYRLSSPRPAQADIRCSTVRTLASPTDSVEASRVSVTAWAFTGMSTGCGRSMRRNTMPVSGGAGRSVNSTRSPLCRPTPTARVSAFNVRCASMPRFYETSNSGVDTRQQCTHGRGAGQSSERRSRTRAGPWRCPPPSEAPERGGKLRQPLRGVTVVNRPACAGRPGSRSRPCRRRTARPPWPPPACGWCATRWARPRCRSRAAPAAPMPGHRRPG
jgi:hypothetical protein